MPVESVGTHELVDRSGALSPHWSIEHFAVVIAVGLAVGAVTIAFLWLRRARR